MLLIVEIFESNDFPFTINETALNRNKTARISEQSPECTVYP